MGFSSFKLPNRAYYREGETTPHLRLTLRTESSYWLVHKIDVVLRVWSSLTFGLHQWGSLTVALQVWGSLTVELQVWGSLTVGLHAGVRLTHSCITGCEAHSQLHYRCEAHTHLHYRCEAHTHLHELPLWGSPTVTLWVYLHYFVTI